MRVTEHSGGDERTILIGCIVNSEFMLRLANKPGKEPFRSRWSNLVWQWSTRHFAKHKKSPGKTIVSLFEKWSNTSPDKETIKLVGRFLASLSGEYEKQEDYETSYLLELAEQHFNHVLLERMQETVNRSLEKGEVEGALQAQQSFKKIELHGAPAIDVLKDEEAQKEALESRQRPLIVYPGDADEFFGSEMGEDSLVAFMAPPKVGKSQLLLDCAWRAMKLGLNVGYIQVGDMSKNQIMRRFMLRAARRPLKEGLIHIPTSIVLPAGYKEPAVVQHRDRTYEKPISWDTARRAFVKVQESTGGSIRLSYHPTKSITAEGVAGVLESWDRAGCEAKVVVLDYTENLAAASVKDREDIQISNTWGTLRRITEERKCCLVTASQSNKDSYSSWVMTRKNFRGSLMILGHVTAFLGINQTPEEKRMGVIRLNYIVRREEEFAESRCLHMASCLAIANPMVLTVLGE
jgi:hypothetical protein